MKYKTTKRLAPDGYQAIDRPSAKMAYEAGLPVTVAGNNVNSYHVFNGWHLGCTIADCDDRQTFDSILANFMFYLEPEIGRYPVFYVKSTDIRNETYGKG